MTTTTLTDDQLVALVQYCGLPGYKAGNGEDNLDLDRKKDGDELAIHQLIRESGLPGYDPAKLATRTAATGSPHRPDMATEPSGTTGHRAPAVAVGAQTVALSKRQFLVLDVAPNGETALAALESV